MIKSFHCKETQKVWGGTVSTRLPRDIQQIARRKLRILNNANQLTDLYIPPGNHLEPLKGNKLGLYSIRINKQWRICFRWVDGNAYHVIIEDYH